MESINDPAVKIAEKLKEQLLKGEEIIPGAAQHALDIISWDDFLSLHHPKSIIELGTGNGSFSKFLQSAPGITYFVTVDNINPSLYIPEFKNIDIFSNPKEIIDLIKSAPKPLLLFCDNGNKKLEVEIFSPFLEKGDYLTVHDYKIEIMPEDIPYDLIKILNSGLTAFFMKC